MPNWCYSRVWIKTDEQSARKLYDALNEALDIEPQENTWLGKLLIFTGVSVEDAEDAEKCGVQCRGSIENYELECNKGSLSGEVRIEMCSAWKPQFGALKRFVDYVLDDAFYLVEYNAEEDGCGAYFANDDSADKWQICYSGEHSGLQALEALYNFCCDEDVREGLAAVVGEYGKLEDLIEKASALAEEDGGFLEMHKYQYADWTDFT